MQENTKLSRFMFHIKFSASEDYINEHELYELTRSRNLYQNQFGVKTNFKKTMRNIAIAEKAERYGFENSRKLFVQRMRERREQADKLRLITSSLKPKGDRRAKKKLERRYVPIPQSTTIYSDFPAIVQMQQANSPVVSVLSERSDGRASHKASPLPVPPTPSVIAATLCSEEAERRPGDLSPMQALLETSETAVLPTRALVAGRTSPAAVLKPQTARDGSSHEHGKLLPAISSKQHHHSKGSSAGQDDFVKKTKRGRGKMQVSTTRLIDGHVEEQPHRTANRHSSSTEKCEEWREKHGLVAEDYLESSSHVRRFRIDRPSKFKLSHVNDDRLVDPVDIRYKMIQKLAKELNSSRHTQGVISEKTSGKQGRYVSLPELESAPRPMVTMDPGGTTPDGRLILTRADYEEYLAGYRRARDRRLEIARRHEQDIGKRVGEFSIGKDLRLREPTGVRGGLVLRAL